MNRPVTSEPAPRLTFARLRAALVVPALLLALGLAACQEETLESGVERAGEEIRDGVNQVGDAIEEGAQQVEERVTGELGPQMERMGSDATITSHIKSELVRDPDVGLFGVDVDTVNGRVSLNGTVKTQDAKDAAEKIARETDGVITVTNLLQVTDN